MTSPTRPDSRPAQLALLVARELPYDDRYQFPRRLLAEHVTSSYRGSGLESAAESAYLAGYRVGERAGQLAASRAAYRMLDQQWYREPDGTKRAWLADCVRRAEMWESDSSQQFYLSHNPHADQRNGRRVLRGADRRNPDQTLPRVAAAAYTLGLDAGSSNAESLTREGVLMYARARAAELGVGPDVVKTALEPLATHPRRGGPGAADPSARPTTVAQLSFPQPATPTAATTPANPVPSRTSRGQGHHR